jgi:hypothetical protein
MLREKTIDRREFLTVAVTCGSLAGCLGTGGEKRGVIDPSDLSIQTQNSTELTAKSVTEDNNEGMEISTNNSVTDNKVIAKIPTSIPEISKSTVYLNIDVNQMDDDAEVEFRFQSEKLDSRSAYIGNEYKTKEKGVIATETGSGHGLEIPFQKLPSSASSQTSQIPSLNQIQLEIRDGDFQGTIWDLGFIFDDKTIVIL